jgi:hypothetical protein
MIQSISKACLGLLRKLISSAPDHQLNEILQADTPDKPASDETETASALLVELISKLLQESHNLDLVLTGLTMSSDLFRKCSPFITEEFTRLGVAHLISQLALQASDEAPELTASTPGRLLPDEFYVWQRAWCVVSVKDVVYAWNQHCCLELSSNSNGWYRFLVNGRLCSMYSNGVPETGAAVGESEDDENLAVFVNKLLKATERLRSGPVAIRTLSGEVQVENWTIRTVVSYSFYENSFLSVFSH